MEPGRLGIWYSVDKLDGPQLRALLQVIEANGYTSFWYPESRGYESMSLGAFLLANSSRLMIGSSIASIYARDAFTARRALVSLNALYGNRYILGLGVSHVPMVEGMRGHHYDKPVPAMRAYLEGIRKDQPDADALPIVVAALGPQMLALSAKLSRGAVPYNVTPQHTAQAAAILIAQRWLGLRAGLLQRAGDAEHDGLGLAGRTAPFDASPDVPLAGALGRLERGHHRAAVALVVEILVQRALIDADRAVACPQAHARHGGLASSGPQCVGGLRGHEAGEW